MCTAVGLNFSKRLFARTLDLDTSYGEEVILTPRGFKLEFLHEGSLENHYAILGVGKIFDGTPLYFDAFNEKGLAAAALNFPRRSVYFEKRAGRVNLASFEIISFLLSMCASISEAAKLLREVNITIDAFSDSLSATPLHWLISDGQGALTLESCEWGIKIYENPVGVLTNSPEFSYHLSHLADFMGVDSVSPENKLFPDYDIQRYSGGLGAVGLPGDFSSASRFVRAVFLKSHTAGGGVSSAFHIMDNLSIPRGAVIREDDKLFYTVYTSVADLDERVYYFTTADSRRIRGVRMSEQLINANALTSFPMREKEQIFFTN